MKVRRYIAAKDYPSLQEWAKDRATFPPPKALLPKRGWIVNGVACIFLIKTDCKVCILEHFMTNKKASEGDRLLACDLLIERALGESMNMGCEVISGSTALPKVIALGLRYGFVSDGKPYYFFTKKLMAQKILEVA